MFIRYPGSKAKIAGRVMAAAFPDSARFPLWSCKLSLYAEPFFGSGAVGWDVLRLLSGNQTVAVINDMDPGIVALWKSVRDCPKELVRMVADFEPSPEAFYRFKEQDGDTRLDPVVLGFQKLALHQMSFSGLGYKSGGPLGGREQRSEYNTSCRWNPAVIAKKILRCHKVMRSFPRFDIRCGDFEAVLRNLPADAFAYIDPPYYVQGESLYRYPMSESDHVRLSACLRQSSFLWALSYDDHPRIRELYSWARIESFEMTPTVQTARTAKRRKNREIVISNPM